MNILRKILETQEHLLEVLIACESATATLYEIYSQSIPEKSKFWKDLSAIECTHATWLEECRSQLKCDVTLNGLSQFTFDTAIKLLKYIWERQIEAEKTPTKAYYAVLVALEIESSIIESLVLKSIKPQNQGVQKVVLRLAADTDEHIHLLQMEKMKNGRIPQGIKSSNSKLPPPLSN